MIGTMEQKKPRARLARFPSVVLARQQSGHIHVVSVTAVAAA
jgi:hypothetical protein